MPNWAAYIEYSETFGGQPSDVGRTVTVQWWQRWQAFKQARASREAWRHFYSAENAVEELSAAEHAAKDWALPNA